MWTDASSVHSKKKPITAQAGATVLWEIARRPGGACTISPSTQAFSITRGATVCEAETMAICAAITRALPTTETVTYSLYQLLAENQNISLAQLDHPFFRYAHSFKHTQILARLYTQACKVNQYLHKVGKRSSPDGDYCPGTEESVDHFVKECPQWEHLRTRIKHDKTPEALVDFAFQTQREI